MAVKSFVLNDNRGGYYTISLNVPDGYSSYNANAINASRFKTAVVQIDSQKTGVSNTSYQIIDLETGNALKSNFLFAGASKISSSNNGTTFYTFDQTSNNIKIFGYEYGLKSNVGAKTFEKTYKIGLSNNSWLNEFIPIGTSEAYVVRSYWNNVKQQTDSELVKISTTSNAVAYKLPALLSYGINGLFIDQNKVWLRTTTGDWGTSSYIEKLYSIPVASLSTSLNNWQEVTDRDAYWNAWSRGVGGTDSVIRDGNYALDLQTLVDPKTQTINAWEEDGRIRDLSSGGKVIFAEVLKITGDDVGYDRYIIFKNGKVEADRSMSDIAEGYKWRSVYGPEDGFIYLQRLGVDFTKLSNQNSTVATSLYRIAESNLERVLDTTLIKNLANIPGVELVKNYSVSELTGLSTIKSSQIAILESYFKTNLVDPADPGSIVVSGLYDFNTDDGGKHFITRFDESGKFTKRSELPGWLEDVTISDKQLFILANNELNVEKSFHVNVKTGLVTEIPISLYEEIGSANFEQTAKVYVGSVGADTLGSSSLSKKQFVFGVDGDDTLIGGAQDDEIYGGSGNDILRGNRGNDILDGGAGVDWVNYHFANNSVTVNLASGKSSGADGVDTIRNVESIHGGAYGDTLTGNTGENTLRGNLGDDILDGGAGIDLVSYRDASGAVTVNLTTGKSSGADGVDTIRNIENIQGSSYGDTLTGNTGENTLRGNLGDDILDGGAGIDLVSYRDASGAVTVNLTTGKSSGADGVDTIRNIENIQGSSYGDTLTGNTFDNTLRGDRGDDILDGGAGVDWVSYRDASAAVTVSLTTGKSSGADGVDTIRNVESIHGGAYGDTLTGNTGENTLRGNLGDDILDGGTGIDLVSYRDATGAVTVNLTTGKSSGADGVDTIRNIENIQGSSYGDTLTGNTGSNMLIGGLGTDLLYAGIDGVRDVFVFNDISESRIGTSRDRVFNFSSGVDDLDLKTIDANTKISNDQAFLFNGMTAKANSVWYKVMDLDGNSATRDIVICADVDGNETADFEIGLVGVASITATDFLL